MQKLLYYAQGCYLAKNNESLIKEDFLAWEHGPIIRKIYDKFRIFGANGIQYDEDYEDKIDEELIICCDVAVAKSFDSTDELLEWVNENTDLKADNGDFKIEGQYLPYEI